MCLLLLAGHLAGLAAVEVRQQVMGRLVVLAHQVKVTLVEQQAEPLQMLSLRQVLVVEGLVRLGVALLLAPLQMAEMEFLHQSQVQQ